MNKRYLGVVLIGFTLAACSSARVKVMSTADGNYRTVVDDVERDKAETAAFKSAQKHCKNQQVVVLNEKTEYRGTMDEKQRALIRKASNAAWMIGKSGSGVETAGQVGRSMTSDRDYRTEIEFRCN